MGFLSMVQVFKELLGRLHPLYMVPGRPWIRSYCLSGWWDYQEPDCCLEPQDTTC